MSKIIKKQWKTSPKMKKMMKTSINSRFEQILDISDKSIFILTLYVRKQSIKLKSRYICIIQ